MANTTHNMISCVNRHARPLTRPRDAWRPTLNTATEHTVSELSGSRSVMKRIDELSSRLEQLAVAVAAGAPVRAGATPTPLPQDFGVDTSGILDRLDEAERVRTEMRDRMLDQMERIASQVDWRIQRLETGSEVPAPVN